MRTPSSVLLVLVAASLALALSGCGGGGGGPRPMTDSGPMMPDDGSTTSPPTTIPTRALALADPTTAANVADAITLAAAARPSPGSVTQSSNVDSNSVTTDQVQVTHRYSEDGGTESVEVRNGTRWSISINEGNSRVIPDVSEPWAGVESSKRIEGGVLYVDVYTDDESGYTEYPSTYDFTFSGIQVGGQNVSQDSTVNLPAVLDGVAGRASCTGCSFVYTTGQLEMTAGSMTFTPSDGSSPTILSAETITTAERDADYLTGGAWLIVPDDASSTHDYEFGAFADGNDPFLQSNLTAVFGTATYDGDATGVYSEKIGGSTEIGYFDGDVTLTADFGGGNDLGTIRGSISNFEVDGVSASGTLNLGAANIGSQDSGFFRGSVTGSDDERSYTGHWGGHFFGNGEADGTPSSVGGTFGGHSTDDAVNFVGAFGAHKQ